jgi:hypothetical protein
VCLRSGVLGLSHYEVQLAKCVRSAASSRDKSQARARLEVGRSRLWRYICAHVYVYMSNIRVPGAFGSTGVCVHLKVPGVVLCVCASKMDHGEICVLCIKPAVCM